MILLSSWDDGANHDIRLAELLKKYNIPATFYIPYDWQNYCRMKGWVPCTEEEMQYIADNFEIGSHTITHPLLTQIDIKRAEKEIVGSKKLLEDKFGKPVTKFCYPRGYADRAIRDIVREHYEEARNTLVGSLEPPEDKAWTPTTVHVACQRKEYLGDHWLDFALAKLKTARKRKNAIYHIWGHSHEISKNDGWKALEYLFSEVSQ